ncbi:hypothetical protein FRB95_002250 [Tulasnella sp. JGI-2019a]|nr:hypothetical protein FRB95_002250 [Tulasnella sp. JGI-2019a]
MLRTDAMHFESPVYRLSEDVLLDILLLVLRDTAVSQGDKRLGDLMLVCPQWKALSDTPSLWAHVSSYQSLSAMKKSLSKSKGTPLDIVYTSYASEHKSEWPKRLKTNDPFLAGVRRWGSFEFRGSARFSTRATGLDAAFMVRLRHVAGPKLDSISLRSLVPLSLGDYSLRNSIDFTISRSDGASSHGILVSSLV